MAKKPKNREGYISVKSDSDPLQELVNGEVMISGSVAEELEMIKNVGRPDTEFVVYKLTLEPVRKVKAVIGVSELEEY